MNRESPWKTSHSNLGSLQGARTDWVMTAHWRVMRAHIIYQVLGVARASYPQCVCLIMSFCLLLETWCLVSWVEATFSMCFVAGVNNVNPGLANPGWSSRAAPPKLTTWYKNGTPHLKQPRVYESRDSIANMVPYIQPVQIFYSHRNSFSSPEDQWWSEREGGGCTGAPWDTTYGFVWK